VFEMMASSSRKKDKNEPFVNSKNFRVSSCQYRVCWTSSQHFVGETERQIPQCHSLMAKKLGAFVELFSI
jgi:hypothetical protein